MVAVMSFSEDLAKAKAAEPAKSEPIRVVVGDHVYELVFEQAPGTVWAAVTSKHPPRPDQPIDRTYGYNFHAVIPDIAQTTCTVTRDGEPVELVVEPWSPQRPNPANEWRDLFAVLDGGAFSRVADAVFSLNQWEPDRRTRDLGKASRVASVTNSDSPAS